MKLSMNFARGTIVVILNQQYYKQASISSINLIKVNELWYHFA
jgi:hypothetical protein